MCDLFQVYAGAYLRKLILQLLSFLMWVSPTSGVLGRSLSTFLPCPPAVPSVLYLCMDSVHSGEKACLGSGLWLCDVMPANA